MKFDSWGYVIIFTSFESTRAAVFNFVFTGPYIKGCLKFHIKVHFHYQDEK